MKKWFALLMIPLMLLMAASVMAESKITVNGTGEVRVAADTAVISLGVSARDQDVLKAQQQVNESIASIRKALTGQGVKEENISTEYINIYVMYDYQNGQEQFAAYNASSTLAIKVTDMESAGSLIDAAFAAGANTLNGINFSASDTKEAESEALTKAVEDAKQKAEVLAQASGLSLTGIENIAESGTYSYENISGNARGKGGVSLEAAADAGTSVQAARLVVSTTISVTFSAE